MRSIEGRWRRLVKDTGDRELRISLKGKNWLGTHRHSMNRHSNYRKIREWITSKLSRTILKLVKR
jgi:hypothetical protein